MAPRDAQTESVVARPVLGQPDENKMLVVLIDPEVPAVPVTAPDLRRRQVTDLKRG